MKITELLKKESMKLGVHVSTKEAAIDELVNLMDAGGRLKDKAGYKEGILAREAQSSTAVGEGIAIPHAKVGAVKEPGLAAIVVPEGVDYEAFDGSYAKLIFMIAAPEGGADVHLEALSRLSTLLMDGDFKNDLLHAKSKEEFLKLIDDKECERYEKKKESKDQAVKAKGYQVLAVTACPTGIAHTFMAAENLEQQGRKMGISVKVETNGAEGVNHALTRAEIEAAESLLLRQTKMLRCLVLMGSVLSLHPFPKESIKEML
jgi:PTS system fructose-specific IIC component